MWCFGAFWDTTVFFITFGQYEVIRSSHLTIFQRSGHSLTHPFFLFSKSFNFWRWCCCCFCFVVIGTVIVNATPRRNDLVHIDPSKLAKSRSAGKEPWRGRGGEGRCVILRTQFLTTAIHTKFQLCHFLGNVCPLLDGGVSRPVLLAKHPPPACPTTRLVHPWSDVIFLDVTLVQQRWEELFD